MTYSVVRFCKYIFALLWSVSRRAKLLIKITDRLEEYRVSQRIQSSRELWTLWAGREYKYLKSTMARSIAGYLIDCGPKMKC